ncbi:MAG: class I SAM-dependent DNA methyltransferase [Thermoplasmatales archaeon]
MNKENDLAPWVRNKYLALWSELKDREFTFEEGVRVLKEKKEISNESAANEIFSELLDCNLLETRKDHLDARKSIYKLKPIIEFTSREEYVSRDDLIRILKKAADLIRTRVNYEFILLLLFLKRISDRWEIEYENTVNELIEKGMSEEEAKEEAKEGVFHEFDIPEEYLWKNLRKDVENLPMKLGNAMKSIAEREQDFRSVFERFDFLQFARNRENTEILRQLMEVFSERKLYHVSPDVLGDAYEWILSYFAPQKAKEGEVYTPREVINLLVELIDPAVDGGIEIYDPACGSGGMLISAYNHIKKKFGEESVKKVFLYGQEVNPLTAALCKMNMFIHDIRDHRIEIGDTLMWPKLKDEEGKIKRFDVVIFNPPWNQDGYEEEKLKKAEDWQERFSYGFTPSQSADWVWVQHALASTKQNGKVGLVIDNGCLFRGGKEKNVRAKILDADLVDCVILLPEKLFYNTGAPGAIILFNKVKPSERRGKVLFINASQEYEKHPEVRKLNSLSDENIRRIVEAYKNFRDVEDFAKVVSLDEVRANSYNLNVTLYVVPAEKGEEIDIFKEFEELKALEVEKDEIIAKLEEYIQKIKEATNE